MGHLFVKPMRASVLVSFWLLLSFHSAVEPNAKVAVHVSWPICSLLPKLWNGAVSAVHAAKCDIHWMLCNVLNVATLVGVLILKLSQGVRKQRTMLQVAPKSHLGAH